jgi:hypothetical protein
MKLINLLKYLILESSFKEEKITDLSDGVNKIILFETIHQKEDRGGEVPLNYSLLNRIIDNQYGSGVYTRKIVESINNNFSIVFNSMINEITTNQKNARIIFTDEFDLVEDKYIEYVLQGKIITPNVLKLSIVTSAYSNNKNYFKSSKTYNTTSVALSESFDFERIKVIHLS